MQKKHNAGFTLIEIIAALVLASLFTLLAALLILPVMEHFLNVKQSARIVQNSQMAMARLSREFMTITNVVSGTSQAMNYILLDSVGTPHQRSVSWSGTSGDPLLLQGAPLLDKVQQFRLGYLDTMSGPVFNTWGADRRGIQVVIDLGGAGSSYTNRIYPRNLR